MATEIPSRELRNNTAAVLRRVQDGEAVVITVHGKAVASMQPMDDRPRAWSGAELARVLRDRQADPGLRGDLDDMYGDETTDDLRW